MVQVSRILLTFTGLHQSKKSDIVKKAFHFEHDTSSAFSRHELMAYNLEKSHGSPELVKTHGRNFEVALLAAMKLFDKKLPGTASSMIAPEQDRIAEAIDNLQHVLKTPNNDKVVDAFMSGIGLVNL